MSTANPTVQRSRIRKGVADWPAHFGAMGANYEQRAFTGSALSAQSDHELSIVLDALGPGNGRTLLDIGAGTGRFTVPLLAAGWKVTSLDGSSEMLDCIGSRASAATLVLGRLGEPLPFNDEEFDAVVAMRVVKYVPETADALAEMVRVARPGGAVLFDVANRSSVARFGYADSPMGFVTPTSLRTIAASVGLEMKATHDGFRLPHAVVGRAQSRLAGRLVLQIEHALARLTGPAVGARSIIVEAARKR
jgi:SAM-dependent methyltransferase